MAIALLNILVALVLGYAAVKEIIERGVQGGEVQPLIIGLAGIIVSLLLIGSGIAFWQRRSAARSLLLIAAISSILFHVYAALPPHRNVGILALLIGVGYGLVLLGVALWSRGAKTQTA